MYQIERVKKDQEAGRGEEDASLEEKETERDRDRGINRNRDRERCRDGHRDQGTGNNRIKNRKKRPERNAECDSSAQRRAGHKEPTPAHPLYLECLDEAQRFIDRAADGKIVHRHLAQDTGLVNNEQPTVRHEARQ